MGIIILLGYLFPAAFLLRSIVTEKETRIREGMLMMGLDLRALYLSWWLVYAVVYSIIALFAAVIGLRLFPHCGFALQFFFWLLFGISTTSFSQPSRTQFHSGLNS